MLHILLVGGAYLCFDVTGSLDMLGTYNLQGQDVQSDCVEPCAGASAGGSLVIRAHTLLRLYIHINISGGSVPPPLRSQYSGASGGRAAFLCEKLMNGFQVLGKLGGGIGSDGKGGTAVASSGTLFTAFRELSMFENALLMMNDDVSPGYGLVPLDIALVPGEYPTLVAVGAQTSVRFHMYGNES